MDSQRRNFSTAVVFSKTSEIRGKSPKQHRDFEVNLEVSRSGTTSSRRRSPELYGGCQGSTAGKLTLGATKKTMPKTTLYALRVWILDSVQKLSGSAWLGASVASSRGSRTFSVFFFSFLFFFQVLVLGFSEPKGNQG